MPACATPRNIAEFPTISNLFLPVPDTDLSAFLDEVAELARFAPEIITAIQNDLDTHALEKKKLRLADRKFYESQTEEFSAMDIEESELRSDNPFRMGSSYASKKRPTLFPGPGDLFCSYENNPFRISRKTILGV